MSKTPPKFKKEVGQRLRTARLSSGFPVKDVCGALIINHTYLYDVEAGRLQVCAYNLIRLCRLYRVSADWVLGGDWK